MTFFIYFFNTQTFLNWNYAVENSRRGPRVADRKKGDGGGDSGCPRAQGAKIHAAYIKFFELFCFLVTLRAPCSWTSIKVLLSVLVFR